MQHMVHTAREARYWAFYSPASFSKKTGSHSHQEKTRVKNVTLFCDIIPSFNVECYQFSPKSAECYNLYKILLNLTFWGYRMCNVTNVSV